MELRQHLRRDVRRDALRRGQAHLALQAHVLAEHARSLHVYAGDFGALMHRRSLWSEADQREGPFSFERLLEQSVIAMKRSGNERGLQELKKAIPAAEKLVGSL